MKVLYDISTLGNIHCAPGVNGAGIFRATEELALELARRPDMHFRLCAVKGQRRNVMRYISDTERFPPEFFPVPAVRDVESISPAPVVGPVSGGMSEQVEQYLDQVYSPERIYNPGRYDIYHVNWGGTPVLPAESHPTVVVTVFDVIPLKHPEWFVRDGQPNHAAQRLSRTLKSVGRGHVVIVNTESVRVDILEMFPSISSEQVRVVPLGVSGMFDPDLPQAEVDIVRAKYAVPEGHRYVLCLNTLEPRKNMGAAVDAFATMVREARADDVSLVLAGSKGWLSEDLFARCEEIAQDATASVVVTGYVDDVDIPALYRGASLFCYPSLDEGFGLPVVEAMRSGVPVVTSDRAPLIEVAGGAAVHVDPLDVVAMASAMANLLDDEAASQRLRLRGLERSADCTWARSAELTAEVYRDVAPSSGRSVRYSDHSLPAAQGGARVSARQPSAAAIDRLAGLGLPEMKDVFRGERAFILGEGPSVEDAAIGLLAKEYTFGVNRLFHRYGRIGWKPSMYAVTGALAGDDLAEVNGLTGSAFFFERSLAGSLRDGTGVGHFDADGGCVDGVGLFGDSRPSDLPSAQSGLPVAIQLAYHLGFDPIYLVGVDLELSTVDVMDTDSALNRWHLECVRAFESAGRGIFNLSGRTAPGFYRRADPYSVVSSSKLPECARSDQATLDETEVISTMFSPDKGPTRVMIDVGAHRGTSAAHFVNGNWTIHCFEPDPGNRRHLEMKYGQAPNLTIDTRAVGRSTAASVPFYTSEESSGISGLSAFRDSHEMIGNIAMTTIAEVVDERAIERIDFLKIDVEGFDLDVLRGVPWDRIAPDVVECEFEDSKTLALGHTLIDIAEFLRARGYSVYVSEWHPIIRYGVPHDWRRVVPYPGVDVPSNAWGNVLAFKTDPGFEQIQAAFARHVKRREGSPTNPEVGSMDVKSSTRRESVSGADAIQAKQMKKAVGAPASAPRRRFYADRADRLRQRSPLLYEGVRIARRSAARLMRHRLLAGVLALVVAAVIGAGLIMPAEWRLALWSGVIACILGLGLLLVAAHASRASKRAAVVHRGVAAARQGLADERKLTSAQSTRIESIRSLNAELGRRVDAIESATQVRDRSVSLEVERLRSDAEELAAVLDRVSEAVRSAQEASTQVRSLVESNVLRSGYANAAGLRMHTRRLGPDDLERMRSHWLKHLGLSMSDREIRYLAHKICLDEERCEGRLATTIQAATMRALSMLSLRRSRVDMLEIGTLFGISAGSLFRVGLRAQMDVHLTLLDPLAGYYGQGELDGQTGVRVSRDTAMRNLAALGVPETHYRLVERLSADPAAVEEVGDREYDLVIIDGDHSLQGVSNDFELYSGMVRPGGILLFDDYDTDDWPSIKPFVDDHVRVRDEWLWIGGEWRTGILQRKPSPRDT